MSTETLPLAANYLRQIAEQIAACGIDPARWLASAGLTPAEFADPAREVSLPQFVRLVHEGLAATGEPALGLLVGERLAATTHGMLGYAALNSETLRQALDLVQLYLPVRTSLVAIRHEEWGDRMRMIFETRPDIAEIARPVLEAVTLTIKNMLETVSMGASRVAGIGFAFPAPDYAALARSLFRAEVEYDRDWTGFTLPLAIVDEPLRMADPAAFEEARQICQRELDKLRRAETLAARLRRLLLDKQGGYPTLEVVARLFNMTPRTLHRRLVDEGTSYREILDDVRHRLALEHLKSPHMSIEEIAYTLGYGELANFRRAFRRWEGMAPSAYRDKARANPATVVPAKAGTS